MTWEEFQPHLKNLNGQATIIVSRSKIKAIVDEMYHSEDWQLQDAIVNCSGIKNARFMGYIGFMYRVPDPKGKGNIGRAPTVELEGKLIYSENDIDRRATIGIIIPIEAIEAIKKE